MILKNPSLQLSPISIDTPLIVRVILMCIKPTAFLVGAKGAVGGGKHDDKSVNNSSIQGAGQAS